MANLITKTQQSILSRLSKVNRLFAQVIEGKLAPMGISYQEMRIVGLLMGETNITQKALAQKLSVRAATLSVAISKLETQGLVKRVPSKTDKRVNYLQLIRDKKIAKVDTLLTALETEMTQGISTEDLHTTSRVLLHIIDKLQIQGRK
jgi:MarR family transcriptional regulator for hemolysin